MSELVIDNLHARVEEREILKGLTLTIRSGEVHALMGPNGSGKSTLAHVLMGKPGYEVTSGTARLDGVDLLALSTQERVSAGLFLAMQYPTEVPGVTVVDVMSEAFAASGRNYEDAPAVLAAEAELIGVSEALLERALNVDLSGGEKKRSDTLQMAVLAPRIAILDEIDSGLDVDALRAVSRRVELASSEGFGDSEPLGVLAITHYTRLLEELHPDFVHIFVGGRIVDSGGPDLADRLEVEGYAAWTAEELAERPESDDPLKTPFDL